MNKTDKIYSAFIVLALLIWNPLTFRWMYSGYSSADNKLMLICLGGLTAAGLFSLFRLSRGNLTPRTKNALFSVSFALLLFFMLVLFDRTIGVLQERKAAQNGPVITENVNMTAYYRSTEFEYTVHYNSIGIRDREIGKKEKFRILCIGDSWTYGWGVALDQSWPKVLEKRLNDRGLQVEVINAGRPGADPDMYKETLARALPILQPDLVLIGINQYDDLSQLYEYNCPQHMTAFLPGPGTISDIISYAFSQFFRETFSHIFAALTRKEVQGDELKEKWKSDIDQMIRNASNLQRIRYFALPDSIRSFYESGNYSSGNFYYNMYYPERKFIINNPHNPATVFAIGRLKQIFREMVKLCEPYGSRLVFANMPNAEFTGHRCVRLPELDSYNTDLEHNNKIDSMYRDLTSRMQIPYIELTGHFRALEDKTAFFYAYDNHPNVNGYREIAAYISDTLPALLTDRP